jgi:DNA-binding response OmpR family regulator
MTPRSILIVDDNPEIREMTRSVLVSAGYHASTAASGREALMAARESFFDLVLLDINMPGMDGWETLRLFKADELIATIPVVMFSVKKELSDKVQGMQDGAEGYITKPFRVDDLLVRVRRVLDSRGGIAAAPQAP